MEAFGTWWEGLSVILKIFWGIAVPFTLFFVLQLILSFFGAESPDDLPDAEIDADHGIPFQFLTLKNLIGFFTIFSWTGIACLEAGLSTPLTLLIASIAGLLMVGLMAGLFYLMMKTGADGTMKINDAIGQSGEVYLTILARRAGIGKIQVKVGGSIRTLDAMTDDEEPLPTGQLARVTQIVNDNILLVSSK
jgi:membrane protein implicated in regulation of membrane protease activity